MTAEVEALLGRLDDISSRSGHEWNAAKDAAALIRAQAEEIARLRGEFEQEHFHYGKVHEEYALCRKLLMERTADWQAAEAKIAAAARQEPIKATCFHTIHPRDAVDDHDFALMPGRYALYPSDLKLYAAPVPTGDAVSEQEESLHIAVCQAVTLINVGDWQQAHTILRESLIAYADAVMPKPATTGDAVRVLGYDADEAILACQRASERRTK
jgi:hypothetical protein